MIRPREEKKKIHHRRGKFMVALGMGLWLIAVANFCFRTGQDFSQQADVVSAFSQMVYSDLSATITANGYLGNMALTENAKYIILEEIAKEIGIYRYGITTDEAGTTTTLRQDSVHGAVEVKLITVREEAQEEVVAQDQYLCVGIQLYHSVESADPYRDIVEQIMKEREIETNVTVNLKGSVQGRMTVEDCESMKNRLMREIGGKVRLEKQMEDSYTVYGYDEDISSYISMGKEKINVNLTMSYDEIHDRTEIHLATPIDNEDY